MGKREILVSFAFVLLSVHVGAIHRRGEEEEGDRIVALPGQPNVSFDQYSGYITVNARSGRALFYWLTESVHAPQSKPLVIWLNGGPGCSSIAYGASEEIGPFRVEKNGRGLYMNKFSWNLVANLLFLETPAGVGFSYTNTSSDLLHTGDQRTAEDSLQFLIGWLDRFPRYKRREIYLTGESYAGHYIPQLARAIMGYNIKAKHPINLKGFMVGNAVTDNFYDNLGTVTYWWSHAMISDKTYKKLLRTCNFHQQQQSNKCERLYTDTIDQGFGNIDQYNIYAPPCNNSDGTGLIRRRLRFPFPQNTVLKQISGYDPCTEKYAEIYYNRPDVQRSLHANSTRIPYKWTACSETLNRNWNDTEISVLPIYKKLIAAGLRVWVFSGDVDSVVPVTATRFSLAQLRLAIKIPWYPWYVKKQANSLMAVNVIQITELILHGKWPENLKVGGWTEVYQGLTFATVRGAGHEVPLVKPRAAFQLFKSFLKGEPLPKS